MILTTQLHLEWAQEEDEDSSSASADFDESSDNDDDDEEEEGDPDYENSADEEEDEEKEEAGQILVQLYEALSNDKHSSFLSLLGNIEDDDFLFAIPLRGSFSSDLLARSGIDSLQGFHRALAERLLRMEGWQAVIARITREDVPEETENKSDGDVPGYHEREMEEGEPMLGELYLLDGSEGSKYRSRIIELELSAYDKGGTILERSDHFEDIWEETKQSSGLDGERYFESYVLVGFRSDEQDGPATKRHRTDPEVIVID